MSQKLPSLSSMAPGSTIKPVPSLKVIKANSMSDVFHTGWGSPSRCERINERSGKLRDSLPSLQLRGTLR